MNKQRIEFGVQVTDVVSGLQGIITGYSTYITGCSQYLVQPKGNGKIKPESHWIDESRLEVMNGKKKINLVKIDVGPDKAAPIR